MKKIIILVLSFTLIFTTALDAGYGSYCSSYSPSYYPVVQERIIIKEIVAPFAVPVLVPAAAFQFLPALQPVAAPPAPVPVAPAASAAVPAPAAAGPQADIDRLVRDRVEAILREKTNQQDSGPPVLILPGDTPAPPPASTLSPVEVETKAVTLLSQRCYECHTQGAKTSGDVTLFTKSGEQLMFQPSVTKAKILAAIESGNMPRKGKNAGGRIVGADLALLKQYLK